MCNELKIKESEKSLYLPERAKIVKIEEQTPIEKVFTIELASGKPLGHNPGQFVELSILGIGEAPISVTSAPSNEKTFQLGIRAVGELTNKIHTMSEGDEVFIRGPFGHGFDADIQKKLESKHLVVIAGGCGYFPVRSLINKVLAESDKYEKISILYGSKTPADQLYVNELKEIKAMGGNVELLEIVDQADAGWTGNEGVITKLIPMVEMKDVKNVIPIIVGPPIMYKFVLKELMALNIPKENIYMSLERRMKCGVGKCGHCQMEGVYVCQEGPVFNYADIVKNEEAL